MMHEQTKIK